MTEQEMIELADKAGFFVKDNEAYSPSVQEDHELTPCLKAFAKLVAEKEREAWEQFYPDIGKPQIALNSEVVGYVAPQRTWVGLTDEEAQQTFAKHNVTISADLAGILARAIEAKLKEKNNG